MVHQNSSHYQRRGRALLCPVRRCKPVSWTNQLLQAVHRRVGLLSTQKCECMKISYTLVAVSSGQALPMQTGDYNLHQLCVCRLFAVRIRSTVARRVTPVTSYPDPARSSSWCSRRESHWHRCIYLSLNPSSAQQSTKTSSAMNRPIAGMMKLAAGLLPLPGAAVHLLTYDLQKLVLLPSSCFMLTVRESWELLVSQGLQNFSYAYLRKGRLHLLTAFRLTAILRSLLESPVLGQQMKVILFYSQSSISSFCTIYSNSLDFSSILQWNYNPLHS